MDVQAVTSTLSGATGSTGPSPVGKTVDGFTRALSEALGTLTQLQQEADALSLQLAAGEPVELHDVMLAQERASLGMQLALQVRNKLVEAYQDIMRMQL